MFPASRSSPPVAALPVTRDMLMFNYRRAVRARRVVMEGDLPGLWLVELLDPVSGLWIWQDESTDGEEAFDCARRLSLAVC